MAIDPNIKKKADDIRTKVYGSEVRESLASGLEAMSSDVVETVGRQGNVESQFQDVIENTTDKDVISAPEIIAARNGEPNLKARLDKNHNEVTAQLAQTPYYDEEISVTTLYDDLSETTYYLTRINHTDNDGNLIRLEHDVNLVDTLTAREHSEKKHTTVSTNAGWAVLGHKFNGLTIKDGVVQPHEITEEPYRHVLGIKEDNTLTSYPPGTTAEVMLSDGVTNAVTAFIPLMVSGVKVDETLLNLYHLGDKHPRQAIAQMANKDIVFLTAGGRGYDGEGMTASDVARILRDYGATFAYMLDGGGSTQTVVRGVQINKSIDADGSVERPHAHLLHVKKDANIIPRDKDIKITNKMVGHLNHKVDAIQGYFNKFEKIEKSGTNIDGQYLQFEDGLQICFKTMDVYANTTEDQITTSPETFVGSVYVFFTSAHNTGSAEIRNALASIGGNYVDGNFVARLGTTSSISTNPYSVSLFAIGRWK